MDNTYASYLFLTAGFPPCLREGVGDMLVRSLSAGGRQGYFSYEQQSGERRGGDWLKAVFLDLLQFLEIN